MAENSKIVPRESRSNGSVEVFPPLPREFPSSAFPTSTPFGRLLADPAQAPVADPTFYGGRCHDRERRDVSDEAGVRRERRSSKLTTKTQISCRFKATDPYSYVMDLDNYIETQSRILTSETLALETIRSMGLADNPEFVGAGSNAIAIGSLKNQKSHPKLGSFLGGLSVQSHPQYHFDASLVIESTDPRTCRADPQCSPRELYRAKLQESVRSHRGCDQVAAVGTR